MPILQRLKPAIFKEFENSWFAKVRIKIGLKCKNRASKKQEV